MAGRRRVREALFNLNMNRPRFEGWDVHRHHDNRVRKRDFELHLIRGGDLFALSLIGAGIEAAASMAIKLRLLDLRPFSAQKRRATHTRSRRAGNALTPVRQLPSSHASMGLPGQKDPYEEESPNRPQPR